MLQCPYAGAELAGPAIRITAITGLDSGTPNSQFRFGPPSSILQTAMAQRVPGGDAGLPKKCSISTALFMRRLLMFLFRR